MFKTRKQLLYRFLKNNKLFTKYHLRKFDERNLLSKINYDFFDNAFSWTNTKEGHAFWLKKQCEFIVFIIKNDKEELFDKYNLSRYFFRILNARYFREGSLTKDSEYYKNICKEYYNFNETLK